MRSASGGIFLARNTRWTQRVMCLLLAAVVLTMQYRSGAYHADLAFDADEPAYVTSSLMVRDYLVQQLGSDPRAFAYTFYAHYPKVAIGHWPPLFFGAEALWMLIAGRSRAALLLFVALCGVALTCSVYCTVRNRTSSAAALVSVAVLLQPKFFQEMLMTVRADMLLALLVFWAAVYCGEGILSQSRVSLILFGVYSMAALAVHGRAAVLLLLPFVLWPSRSRFSKWKWVLAAGVLAIIVVLAHRLGQTDQLFFRTPFLFTRVFLQQNWRTLSSLTLFLSVAGIVLALQMGARSGPFWVTMAAMVGCSFLFRVTMQVPWDDRFLLTAFPAVAALAGLAMQNLLTRCRSLQLFPVLRVAVSVLALLAIAYNVSHTAVKPDRGYRQFVAVLPFQENAVVLIDGDGQNEGGLIVESSLADPNRNHTILRGSKVLAQTNWVLRNFTLTHTSGQDVLAALEQAHVGLILVQNDDTRPDFVQLRSALAEDSSAWPPLSQNTSLRSVSVYRHQR